MKRQTKIVLTVAAMSTIFGSIPAKIIMAQSSERQALQSAVEVPRASRVLTAVPTGTLGTETLSDFLFNLDFARKGNPPSRIDPVQVMEIVALSRGIEFEPGDRVSLSVISGADRGRQVVVELSVRSPARALRLRFRLDDGGRYEVE